VLHRQAQQVLPLHTHQGAKASIRALVAIPKMHKPAKDAVLLAVRHLFGTMPKVRPVNRGEVPRGIVHPHHTADPPLHNFAENLTRYLIGCGTLCP